jgi:hypothetical protein
MRNILKYSRCLLLITIILGGCAGHGSREYEALKQQELAKGIRQDSVFMSIRFGMTSKEFYLYCWEMNKKNVFTNGTRNISVLYKLPNELKHPVSMNFYPDFDQNKLYKMWATFEYDAWAPWNRNLCSDSLLPDVLRLYRKWYEGNDFIKLTDTKRGTIFVKVDGNRRITVGTPDERLVKVDYTDLLVEQQLKK